MSNVYEAGVAVSPAATRSAVAWPAIFAGSVAGAGVSIILVLLGAGIGLSVISPWGGGASPVAIGIGAIAWVIVVEWVAAGFAGYFAGRLRTRMHGFHNDEVFFRDTSHGFVAWAFSLIILTAISAWSAAGILGKTADTAATVTAGVAQGAGSAAGGAASAIAGNLDPNAYLVDRLFRSAPAGMAAGTEAAPTGTTAASAADATAAPAATATTTDTTAPADTATDTTAPATTAPATTAPADTTAAAPAAAAPAAMTAVSAAASTDNAPEAMANAANVRAEGGRILTQSLSAGQIAPEDRTYLAGIVAEQTGITQAEAEQRVDAAMSQAQAAEAKAKEAADAARSAAAKASLFLALSLFIGAFIACVAAALGGKERDDMDPVVVART